MNPWHLSRAPFSPELNEGGWARWPLRILFRVKSSMSPWLQVGVLVPILQHSLFRSNGRAREAKPLFSQHLHGLSDRWALRINSLYVCWPSAEPAACSWPPWLLSTPWLPRQSLESPSLRNCSVVCFFSCSETGKGVGGLLLWEVCHIYKCLVTPIEWQIYLTIFDKWVVCDSLTEGIICNSNLKAWPSESND